MLTAEERCIDLAFCVDETGSMGSYISQVKQHIISIISDILQDPSVDSLRVGLVGYRDHPPQDSSFVTQVLAFTEDISEIKAAVNAMEADGGGDGPECMTDGLYEVVRLRWRPRAAKVVVLIADAPPHGAGDHGDGFPQGSFLFPFPLHMTRDGVCAYSSHCFFYRHLIY